MVPRILAATVAAALIASPVLARDIVVTGHAPSLRTIELDQSGTDRIDAARRNLANAIPIGSSMAEARALLVKTGLHCADAAPAHVRCTLNQFEAVDEMLHDVAWTVAVDHDGGAVTALSVDRISIGN